MFFYEGVRKNVNGIINFFDYVLQNNKPHNRLCIGERIGEGVIGDRGVVVNYDLIKIVVILDLVI